MKLEISYKNGNKLTQKVHYVHTEDGKLYFTENSYPSSAVREQVVVSLKNVTGFNVIIEEGDEA